MLLTYNNIFELYELNRILQIIDTIYNIFIRYLGNVSNLFQIHSQNLSRFFFYFQSV